MPKAIKPAGPITQFTADEDMLAKGYAVPRLGETPTEVRGPMTPTKRIYPPPDYISRTGTRPFYDTPFEDNLYDTRNRKLGMFNYARPTGPTPPPLISRSGVVPNSQFSFGPGITGPAPAPNVPSLMAQAQRLAARRRRLEAIEQAENVAIEHARKLGKPMTRMDLHRIRQRAALLSDIDARNPNAAAKRQFRERRKAREDEASKIGRV